MHLTFNGDHIEVADDLTVARLVDDVTDLGDRPSGVAVAVDGALVPRSRWRQTTLADGQQVEILTAVQGG